MSKKNFSTKAFANAKEGSLTNLGWPNAGKLVEAARSNRKKVVGKLLLLAMMQSFFQNWDLLR